MHRAGVGAGSKGAAYPHLRLNALGKKPAVNNLMPASLALARFRAMLARLRAGTRCPMSMQRARAGALFTAGDLATAAAELLTLTCTGPALACLPLVR